MDYDALINQTNTEYDRQKKTYEDQRARQEAALKANYDTQINSLGKTRDAALREAYINREIQKRDMPSLLAMQGIKGGATETALSSLFKNYQNARNSVNNEYMQNSTAAGNSYNTELANLGSNYADRLAGIEANRSNALMQLYQQKAAQEQAEKELAAQTAAMQSYGGSSGGSSGGGGYTATGGGAYNTQYGESDASKANSYVQQKWAEKQKARQKQINAMQSIYGKMY